MTRLVTYVDTVDGIALFVTPSWSGKTDENGNKETYEISVIIGEWRVKCNCFGSNRWKLHVDLLNPNARHGCKHAKCVSELVKRHLEQ